MTIVQTIVAATDFSPASTMAVARAAQLATEHGAALCLLHAFDAGGDPAAGDAPNQAVRERLAEVASAVGARIGAAVDVHAEAGTPLHVIGAYVGAHPGALVVVGSREDPAVAGLGSTASSVVHAPACPVLIVRASEAGPYDKVLTAVDLREGSLRAASFAVALFPAAHHHLLYALDAQEDIDDPSGSELDEEQLRSLFESMHSEAKHDLHELARRLSERTQHPVGAEVADDVPARAILVGAASLPADCVVVGHHGHGTPTDSTLGSMAQHVVHSAISDVLVVP